MPPGIAASAPAPPVAPSPDGDTWVGITAAPLDAAAAGRWATTPDVGAVVTFSGTVRDHAPGRDGVTALTYEAYEEAAVDRLAEVVADVRRRWPDVRRVAAVHRTGPLAVGETAVVVAVGAPHRGPAFAAAAHCIDTLKATVPLWKKETWAGGEEWGTDATPIEDADAPAAPRTEGAGAPAAPMGEGAGAPAAPASDAGAPAASRSGGVGAPASPMGEGAGAPAVPATDAGAAAAPRAEGAGAPASPMGEGAPASPMGEGAGAPAAPATDAGAPAAPRTEGAGAPASPTSEGAGATPDGLVGPAAAPGARDVGASPSRRAQRASAGTTEAAHGRRAHDAEGGR